MLDLDTLFRDLDKIGLSAWQDALRPLLLERTAAGSHGHLAAWRKIINELPGAESLSIQRDTTTVAIDGDHLSSESSDKIRILLRGLTPWRKGPFRIRDIELDTEWRSDMKWNRIIDSISLLAGRRILDIGCGNGYYAFRMLAEGAEHIIGIDPTLLYVCQFLALKKLAGIQSIHVLPLRLCELPAGSESFDTTFSMGVLYHQRNPHEHLWQLRDTLRPGGEMVLETLVLPGNEYTVLQPDDRYARMRNVWHLPSVSALIGWLQESGYSNIRVADVSTTTIHEQRTTSWMPFESLAEALHPGDQSRTTEGLPAPTRAVVICNKA